MQMSEKTKAGLIDAALELVVFLVMTIILDRIWGSK